MLEILFNSEKRERYSVILASKLINFSDLYDKLLKYSYDCNFILNSVKKNEVKLPLKYGDYTRSEFNGISATLVLASVT